MCVKISIYVILQRSLCVMQTKKQFYSNVSVIRPHYLLYTVNKTQSWSNIARIAWNTSISTTFRKTFNTMVRNKVYNNQCVYNKMNKTTNINILIIQMRPHEYLHKKVKNIQLKKITQCYH